MGKTCEVDFKELQQLKEKLEQFDNFNKKAFMKQTVQEIAENLLDIAVEETPFDTGKLQDSWKMTDVVDHGSYVEVIVYNPVDYASHVEYGHEQEVGRYVPKLGKKLVKDYIKGRFFLKKSEILAEEDAVKIVKSKLQKALEDLLNA